MATLPEIETKTKAFADARSNLSFLVNMLAGDIERCKKAKLPGIKAALEISAKAQNELRAAVDESAGLFKKPRTVLFHGIKVGFQKQKGRISWAEDAQVIKLIREHLPDQAAVLIRTVESPIKDALAELAAETLMRLGVTVEADGDKVLIKAADSDIDKMVDALLKAATDEEEPAASAAD